MSTPPFIKVCGPARLRMKYWVRKSEKGHWSFSHHEEEEQIRKVVPEIGPYDSISGVGLEVDMQPIEPGEYAVDVWVSKPSFLWEVVRVVPVSLLVSTQAVVEQKLARERADFAGFTREEMDREVARAFEDAGIQIADYRYASPETLEWRKAYYYTCGYVEPLNLFYRRCATSDEMREVLRKEASYIRATLDATPVVWGYRPGYYQQGMPRTTSSFHTEGWYVGTYQLFARPGTTQDAVQDWYDAQGKPEGTVQRGIAE